MNRKERMEWYLKRMNQLADKTDGDWEIKHGEADRILCDIIKIELKKYPQASKIVDAFDNVGKWYA